MAPRTPLLASALLALLAAGCSPGAAGDSKYPPRPEGCEVQVFVDTPTVPTDNIGAVSASCEDSVSDADCLTTLKDEACKLGGDVVWGVDPKPTLEGGRKKLYGRAAHTTAAAK